jgi:hypothetical protein
MQQRTDIDFIIRQLFPADRKQERVTRAPTASPHYSLRFVVESRSRAFPASLARSNAG